PTLIPPNTRSTLFPYTPLFRSNFLSRSDVANQLQSLGIDPSTANDRVAAMTDQEVQSLAGRINAMPAGERLHFLVGHRGDAVVRDRKSTRLNSSHVAISYAVFC